MPLDQVIFRIFIALIIVFIFVVSKICERDYQSQNEDISWKEIFKILFNIV